MRLINAQSNLKNEIKYRKRWVMLPNWLAQLLPGRPYMGA